MPNRVEGNMQCLAAPIDAEIFPENSKGVAATEGVNRVEQAKVEEREYAEGNPLKGGMRGYLDNIPTPGAAEFELHGFVDHNGIQSKVEIERTADGEFEVKLKESTRVGMHLGVGAFLQGNVGANLKFRTPEAAADFLTSLAGTQAPSFVGDYAKERVKHYGKESLHQISLGYTDGASAYLPMPCLKAGLEAKGEATVTYDANRGSIIVDQAVVGEATGRFGIVMMGGGADGAVAAHVRSEVRAPPDALERLRSGQLSLKDLLSQSTTSSKLILESEGRAEITTNIAPDKLGTALVRAEAEIDLAVVGDLKSLYENPERAKQYMHGKVKTYQSTESYGSEFQWMVADVKLQATRYSVTERELFHGDDHGSMQKELDAKRLTNGLPR
ncbi:MAG: hypothetical protein QM817_03320 [Archangium sp.]